MYQNIATKSLTGVVRLSYAHLTAPWVNPNQPNGKAKYSVTLLIPKTDTATVADLRASFEAAAREAVNKKWGGVRPPVIPDIIHDGDGVRGDGTPYGDECKGHYVLTASSEQKPQVVDISNIRTELAPQDIYSGMYARVTVNFFGFNTAGKKGVGCGLGNVLKVAEGEPLSGGASAESDFAGLEQPGAAPVGLPGSGVASAPATAPWGAAAPAPAAPAGYAVPAPAVGYASPTVPAPTIPAGVDPAAYIAYITGGAPIGG